MNNQKEVWKAIKGFESRYKISDKGRIKILSYGHTNNSIIPEKIVIGVKHSAGYLNFGLRNKGEKKVKRTYVHILVAKHFIPNPKNKPFVNHINGIKTDNRIENLEWVTAKENIRHAMEVIKTFNNFGKKNYKAVLKNEENKEILKLLKRNIPQRDIAKLFSVCQMTVSRVKNGYHWSVK